MAVAITRDLLQRITVLLDLGLGYLALGRSTPTLSPGEMQRLRIATQLRSGLFGVIYVLDEPSAGLHPADAEPLLAVLDQLKSSGNSVFVVEHNMDVVRRADWLVDVGPRAGEGGGEVLYSGPVAGLADVEESVTRPFLFGNGSGGAGALPGMGATTAARLTAAVLAAPAGSRPAGWSCATSAVTTCADSMPISRSASSPRSPGSPARASRPWSARCSPKWWEPGCTRTPVPEPARTPALARARGTPRTGAG